MELLVKNISHVNLKDNEIYLLSGFNINVSQHGNDNLNREETAVCQGPVHASINRYQEFVKCFFYDTHSEKAPSIKTPALTKKYEYVHLGCW